MVRVSAKLRRLRYVYGWRLRYWWLDTRGGAITQRVLGVVALLAIAVQLARAGFAAAAPSTTHPKQAILWVLVWAIVALVAGLVLALTASKPAAQPPDQEAKAPTTQDGKSAVRYYGTNWIKQPAMLAWKVTGRDPIQTKSGKK